jgi:glutamate-5-semialdehyde dehydrogenase
MFEQEIRMMGQKARKASRLLAGISSGKKDSALLLMAESLVRETEKIIEANGIDVQKGIDKGLSKALVDRLLLNPQRIQDMAQGLRELAALPDPVGEVDGMWQRPNGIQIGKVRVPMGVIGIIYEARPNVTVDAAGLCLKSGNAVLLRGSSEAINSNKIISRVIAEAANQAGLPQDIIQLVEHTDREAVNIMLKANGLIDVIIPRGGAGLIKNVVENSTVPVIETGVGNCHVYVDELADLKMAEDIVINSKCHRPGVCNAMETLLVHSSLSKSFLPAILDRLKDLGVEIRGDQRVKEQAGWVKEASEEDWYTEYLDMILAVKLVDSMDDAIEHIYTYGTKHSESIVTKDYSRAMRFLKEIDSSAVYVNASTRFTDGHQFGFGAEIGISTQKLHARGPMGLKELTTYKYIIYGNGQIRS